MSDVFISYSRQDAEVARRLHELLRLRGLSVFSDADSLVTGEDFSKTVTAAISDAKAVLVLLSEHSKRSRWVEDELSFALESGQTVIPVLLDEDAKENWVWPLVADRQAVRVDSYAGLKEVVERVENAIGNSSQYSRAELPVSAPRSRWLLVLVAVLSALLGAIVALFLR